MVTLKCTAQRINKSMKTNLNLNKQSFTFPIIGKATFNEDNCIDVEESKVEDFLKMDCGFEFQIVDETLSKKIAESNEAEKATYKAELEKLDSEEIDALFQAHANSKDVKKNTTKEDKIAFLVKKQFK